MSCVTSWWKADQNTSGHYNIFASAATTAGVDCQFHFADTKCGSSVIIWGRLRAGLIVSVKCVVFTWVVLGFICRVAELNVKVDAEDGVMAVVPRDWGERSETQV